MAAAEPPAPTFMRGWARGRAGRRLLRVSSEPSSLHQCPPSIDSARATTKPPARSVSGSVRAVPSSRRAASRSIELRAQGYLPRDRLPISSSRPPEPSPTDIETFDRGEKSRESLISMTTCTSCSGRPHFWPLLPVAASKVMTAAPSYIPGRRCQHHRRIVHSRLACARRVAARPIRRSATLGRRMAAGRIA